MHKWAHRWAYLLLMAAFTPAVAAPPAATSLTVDELDRLLAQMHERGDGKTARQLAGLKLTERASAAQLARWEAGLPGSHAREALIALADASAFLHPPASELLSAGCCGREADRCPHDRVREGDASEAAELLRAAKHHSL